MKPTLASFATAIAAAALVSTSSCTSLLTSSVFEPAFDNMGEQSDLQLVCEGTPPYLLMVDALAADRPDDLSLLLIGTKAYSGYVAAMEECGMSEERLSAMADKASGYSTRLLQELLHIAPAEDYSSFTAKLEKADRDDADELFWSAFGLIVWVQQQQGAPSAMARLGKIEHLLLKVVELDETVESGGAHFLLGGYYGSRPKMLGGDPVKSRHHFERALELSDRRMLIFQTIFAKTYARQTMNQKLHDALLREVLDFPLESAKENRLTNQIAKRKAKRLLTDGFFAN